MTGKEFNELSNPTGSGNWEENIFALGLHEVAKIHHMFVVRVPGGWIYEFEDTGAAVFVPLPDSASDTSDFEESEGSQTDDAEANKAQASHSKRKSYDPAEKFNAEIRKTALSVVKKVVTSKSDWVARHPIMLSLSRAQCDALLNLLRKLGFEVSLENGMLLFDTDTASGLAALALADGSYNYLAEGIEEWPWESCTNENKTISTVDVVKSTVKSVIDILRLSTDEREIPIMSNIAMIEADAVVDLLSDLGFAVDVIYKEGAESGGYNQLSFADDDQTFYNLVWQNRIKEKIDNWTWEYDRCKPNN